MSDEFVGGFAVGAVVTLLGAIVTVTALCASNGFRHDIGADQRVCMTVEHREGVRIVTQCASGAELLAWLRKKATER